MPNKGRDERNKGSKAQCMAQAAEAVIPKKSQFILNFIRMAKIQKSNNVAKLLLQ